MSFNIEQTLKDMLKSVADVLGDEGPEVTDALEQVLRDEKEALQEIAEALIKGEISDDDLKDQLEDEKEAFKAGLSMVEAVSKATLQNAINAGIDTFWKAVRVAL